MDEKRGRLKQAELLSTVGAGVLGAGLALLLERWLAGLATGLLVVGLLAHGWGMYTKRRLEDASREASQVPRVPWEDVMYWLCWVALAALAGYIILRAF